MDVFNLIMVALGFIITSLMAIIGFFLKQQIKVINTLTDSVNSLQRTVAVLENKTENSMLNCGYKHTQIDARLNNHAERLDTIDKDVAVLKSKNNESN